MTFRDVSQVVHLSSDIYRSCTECSAALSSLEDRINHYIDKHGYFVMHAGQETTQGIADELWQSTTALLGKNG